ncbi:hypothetical protein B0H10DRAFT_2026893, partial [Mycena sp. CBHHK59/15]
MISGVSVPRIIMYLLPTTWYSIYPSAPPEKMAGYGHNQRLRAQRPPQVARQTLIFIT